MLTMLVTLSNHSTGTTGRAATSRSVKIVSPVLHLQTVEDMAAVSGAVEGLRVVVVDLVAVEAMEVGLEAVVEAMVEDMVEVVLLRLPEAMMVAQEAALPLHPTLLPTLPLVEESVAKSFTCAT
jgi:hypothetical protein